MDCPFCHGDILYDKEDLCLEHAKELTEIKREIESQIRDYPDWNDNGPGQRAHETAIGRYSVGGVLYQDGKRIDLRLNGPTKKSG